MEIDEKGRMEVLLRHPQWCIGSATDPTPCKFKKVCGTGLRFAIIDGEPYVLVANRGAGFYMPCLLTDEEIASLEAQRLLIRHDSAADKADKPADGQRLALWTADFEQRLRQHLSEEYEQANVGETQIIDVFEESANDRKAAELMTRMAEDLRSGDMTVEQVVDKYVTTATPELRQQLIDKMTKMRERLNADETEEADGKTKAAGE